MMGPMPLMLWKETVWLETYQGKEEADELLTYLQSLEITTILEGDYNDKSFPCRNPQPSPEICQKTCKGQKKVVNLNKNAKFQAERDLSPAIGDVSNVTFDLPDTFDACKVASTIVTIADEHLSAIQFKYIIIKIILICCNKRIKPITYEKFKFTYPFNNTIFIGLW